jgi:hypothetical protein
MSGQCRGWLGVVAVWSVTSAAGGAGTCRGSFSALPKQPAGTKVEGGQEITWRLLVGRKCESFRLCGCVEALDFRLAGLQENYVQIDWFFVGLSGLLHTGAIKCIIYLSFHLYVKISLR